MTTIVKGGNLALVQADGRSCQVVCVGVGWQRAEADIDLCVLLCDENAKVLSDEHFLFWDNRISPMGDALIAEVGAGLSARGADRAQLVVNLAELDQRVQRVLVTLSTQVAGESISTASDMSFRIFDLMAEGDANLVTYVSPGAGRSEVCVEAVELYLRSGVWKARVVDQGYSEGLAALARVHNVNVE